MTIGLPHHFNNAATLFFLNSEVVVWSFTTMNSYWVANA